MLDYCGGMINCSIIRNLKTSGCRRGAQLQQFFGGVLKGVGPVSQSTDCARTPSEPQSVVSGGMSMQLPLQSSSGKLQTLGSVIAVSQDLKCLNHLSKQIENNMFKDVFVCEKI